MQVQHCRPRWRQKAGQKITHHFMVREQQLVNGIVLVHGHLVGIFTAKCGGDEPGCLSYGADNACKRRRNWRGAFGSLSGKHAKSGKLSSKSGLEASRTKEKAEICALCTLNCGRCKSAAPP
jgi:hypothetical protein